MRKHIVVFEGVDGSGKSAVSSAVSSFFYPSVLIHFPSELTVYGMMIHNAKSGNIDITPFVMLDAFILDMCKVMNTSENLSVPLLIIDRYFYSTLVYQPIFNGIREDVVRKELEEVHLPVPDIAFLLDVDIDTARQRILERNQQNENKCDIFDKRFDKIEKAITRYREIAEEHSMIVIDATQPLDDVITQCLNIIERRFNYGIQKKTTRSSI